MEPIKIVEVTDLYLNTIRKEGEPFSKTYFNKEEKEYLTKFNGKDPDMNKYELVGFEVVTEKDKDFPCRIISYNTELFEVRKVERDSSNIICFDKVDYTVADINLMMTAVKLSNYSVDEVGKGNKPLGGPFGAIVVKDNKIVGMSCNRVLETNDPTAHAEVSALRDACHNLGTFDLSGCRLYTSCESCGMCAMAIQWANIKMEDVFYAATAEDAGKIGFRDDEMRKQFKDKVTFGRQITVCRKDAVDIMEAWKSTVDSNY